MGEVLLVVYPVCPTEPVLGALPSNTAAAEGLAKLSCFFSPWHLEMQVASPGAGQSPGLSPLQDRCSWVPQVVFSVSLLLPCVMAAVLSGIVTSKRSWHEECKNMAKHLLK